MSNIGTVSGVESQRFQPVQLTSEQVQQRVQLFTGDSMESAQASAGVDAASSGLAHGQLQVVTSFYGNASADQQTQLAQVGNNVFRALTQSGAALESNPAALSSMQESFTDFISITGEQDVNAATNGIMMMGLSDAQSQVLKFGTDLKGKIEAKKTMREDITDVREMLAAYPEGWETTTDVDGNEVTKAEFSWLDADGVRHTDTMTKAEAETHLGTMESTLESISDMTQMMQMDLERAMQLEQQYFQTMSNIMKMMHDTAKSIISNLK